MTSIEKGATDARRDRVQRAIDEQREFVHRVPDPDTREKAELHLIELMLLPDGEKITAL